ncbi:hypothetical protein MAXJ12_27258 [Mesorhizobium alhagi CCNWXJ12-2]|uniref:Uncharacterized protein n=1 Tax=Mesorhizobium alhagi CCNWXJ12-2 TaxID=1107882 RepID=H0HZ17_9HYPH|nr:hypothetical protein MAXJ12_27258 [Mesorhizobium alhagi CCNWXJ12-2]
MAAKLVTAAKPSLHMAWTAMQKQYVLICNEWKLTLVVKV